MNDPGKPWENNGVRRRWRVERSRIVDSDDIAVCLVLEPEPGYPGYTPDIVC